MKYPTVSVIIPTFNEEKRIDRCLSKLQEQDYKGKIEIIIVDDGSTDKTCQIALKHKAIIVKNGTHNIERGKSIGFENSTGTYIFFLDADNFLTTSSWIRDAIDAFQKHPDLVGVQSYKFLYKKEDSMPNRYSALFGVNDPLVYYLGKRGLLKTIENKWIYPETLIEDNKKYFLTKFNTNNLPTLGSQGYMTRRDLILMTHWKPYLFHMDSIYDLVAKGHNTFALYKSDIEHDYSPSLLNMFKKWYRNILLYYKFKDVRRYKYDLNIGKLLITLLLMVTLIIPLADSIKGYSKKKDLVWFLHPVLGVCVIAIYSYAGIKQYLNKID